MLILGKKILVGGWSKNRRVKRRSLRGWAGNPKNLYLAIRWKRRAEKAGWVGVGSREVSD